MTPPSVSETLRKIAAKVRYWDLNDMRFNERAFQEVSELAAAAIPLAEKAEQDTARLDWLESHCGFQVQIVRRSECFGNDIEIDVNNGPTGTGKTLREAIDEARAKEGQKDVG